MLKPIADDLWSAEHDHYMYGFIHFRGRMTVIRLGDGSLVLHSPVPIDDALAAELAELGPVAHLVAPNRVHHVHLAKVRERYPSAKLWAAPGLPAKRRDLEFDAVLGETPGPWTDELDQLRLDGNAWLNEFVFLHRPSRTLIVTDLVFNIQDAGNVWTRLVLRMAGAYQELAQSRALRGTTKDRDAMRLSIDRMLQWRFDRLVMAHGDIVETDAHDALTHALWWMRGLKSLPVVSAA